MQVKICGITTAQAAHAACIAGADMLGFVFADSTRNISPERARDIIGQLPAGVKTVGVFVNETYENIVHISKFAGLDYIQLHGDETAEFCQELPLPVIKAFSIKHSKDLDVLGKYDVAYYLLDSPGHGFRGGSGNAFDWGLLQDKEIPRARVILAGGLHAGNVQEAIENVHPACVDVSSGVETAGKKDLEKIALFIATAKHRESGKNDSIHST